MTNNNEPGKILPVWTKIFISREEFLKFAGLCASGLIAGLVTIPAAAFIFEFLFMPVRRPWVAVGPVDQFEDGETKKVTFNEPYSMPWDGVSGHRSAWLRRVSESQFVAFAINCTHLGCPVRWEETAR